MGELNIPVQQKPKSYFDDDQYNEYLLAVDEFGIEDIEDPVTEEELLKKDLITPDDVIRLRTYTESYLCPTNANIYGIQFIRYSVRDFERGVTLFELKTHKDPYEEEISKEELDNQNVFQIKSNEDLSGAASENVVGLHQNKLNLNQETNFIDSKQSKPSEMTGTNDKCLNEISSALDSFQKDRPEIDTLLASDWVIVSTENFEMGDCDDSFEDEILDDFYLESTNGPQFISERQVSYHLPSDVLQISTIGATVEFKIGNQEIQNFRMIELHFFKDKLIKMFDFDFGFCIPNSLNSWEHIYQLPKLPKTMITEMINSPYETKSETFYFVDGKLVIHNKADYAYKDK